MALKLGHAMEELAIERVMRQKKTDASGTEFDQLYSSTRQEVEDKKRAEREETEETTGPDQEDEAESVENDHGEDGDQETQTEPDVSTADTALESFLQHHRDAVRSNVSTEALFTKENLAYVGEKTLAGLSHLKDVGFKYGAVSLKHVYKGVVAALNKTFYAITRGTIALKKYVEKRINSYPNMKERIKAAREALELLDEKSDKKVNFQKEAIFNKLIIGGSLDIENNLKTALRFYEIYFKYLSNNVRSSVQAANQIVKDVVNGNVVAPNSVMKESFTFDGFKPKAVNGYKPPNQFLDSYCYRDLLPGNLLFMGFMPTEMLDTHEDIVAAYSDSRLFFAASPDSKENISEIEMPSIEELKKILDLADKICDFGISLEKSFEAVIKEREALKGVLSPYVKFLLAAQNKVSIRDSMAEYVSLKVKFLDSTSIAGALYINDYMLQVVTASLSLVKSGIKEYS